MGVWGSKQGSLHYHQGILWPGQDSEPAEPLDEWKGYWRSPDDGKSWTSNGGRSFSRFHCWEDNRSFGDNVCVCVCVCVCVWERERERATHTNQNFLAYLQQNIEMQYSLYLGFGPRIDDDDNKKLGGMISYKGSLPQTRPPELPPKKSAWRSRSNKQTGSKLGKEYIKAVYCHQ